MQLMAGGAGGALVKQVWVDAGLDWPGRDKNA